MLVLSSGFMQTGDTIFLEMLSCMGHSPDMTQKMVTTFIYMAMEHYLKTKFLILVTLMIHLKIMIYINPSGSKVNTGI